MNQVKSISILHIILISMTFIGLKNHVTIIPALLQSVGRDGWMSVILSAILFIPWLFMLVFIHKKSKQQPINIWLINKLGKPIGTFIIYTTAIFLIFVAAFTLRETLLWVGTSFLPKTPMLIMLLLFTLLIGYLISTSIETIAILNVFVLFGVVVLGFLVAFVNVQVKDIELLRPFLEHGFSPVMNGLVYPSSGFVELLLLIFLQHKVKGHFNFRHFIILLFIIAGLTLGPLIGAITEFGPVEAAKQRFPAYEEWGLATIGRYIEHLDFFSVYQWLTGAFIRISILLFIVAELLKISGDRKQIWRLIAPPFFFISAILTTVGDVKFLNFHEHDFLTFTFFYFFALSIILFIAALLPEKDVKKIHGSD